MVNNIHFAGLPKSFGVGFTWHGCHRLSMGVTQGLGRPWETLLRRPLHILRWVLHIGIRRNLLRPHSSMLLLLLLLLLLWDVRRLIMLLLLLLLLLRSWSRHGDWLLLGGSLGKSLGWGCI